MVISIVLGLQITRKVLVTTIYVLGLWDTFKQDNQSTVGGDGDVGSTRYEPALLPPCLTKKVLGYSNCQRSTHSISDSET